MSAEARPRPARPLPRTIVIEITYRCNLRCKMCWWWGKAGIVEQRERLDDELSLGEWKRFIDSVSFFRPHIRMTGGEPFVRQDLFELIEYMRTKSLSCSFITNGTLFESSDVARLVDTNVERITFSVHGDRQADARVRGAGAFDKTMAAVETLSTARRRLAASRPKMLINCVVSADNLDGLSNLIRVGRGLGVRVRVQHLMWYDERTVRAHALQLQELFGLDDPTLSGFVYGVRDLDYERLSDILQREGYIERQDPEIVELTLPVLTRAGIRRWYTDLDYCRATRCDYPARAARIKANGEVIACPFIDYPLGNVRQRHLADIFCSPPARRFRRIVSQGLLPGCVRCCKLWWYPDILTGWIPVQSPSDARGMSR